VVSNPMVSSSSTRECASGFEVTDSRLTITTASLRWQTYNQDAETERLHCYLPSDEQLCCHRFMTVIHRT